jgi:hypothetical protein
MSLETPADPLPHVPDAAEQADARVARSVSWGGRTARRATAIGAAAVSFFLVAPAIANAAGAHLPNPVLAALESTGSAITSAFSTGGDDVVAPAPTHSGDSNDAPEVDKSEAPEPDKSEAPDAEASDSPAQSAIVTVVAHCAPRGHDALVATWGNHGAAVSAAAKGDTLSTPGGSFDLSTPAGAAAYCAAVKAAAAAAPASKTHGKGHGTTHGRSADAPGKAKKAEHAKASKPADDGSDAAAGAGRPSTTATH